MLRTRLALAALAALAGCSFDTRSLVSGADAAADTSADAAPDAAPDAGRTIAGWWRVTRVETPLGTATDTGTSRVNGLVRINADSASLSYASVFADRAHLAHNALLCPSPRTIDFTGRGLLGRLDDARNTFTVTEGATPPTFNFRWVDDRTLELTYHIVIDISFTLSRLTLPARRDSYSGSIEVEIGDEQCTAAMDANPRHEAVLLWENPMGDAAIAVGPSTPITRTTVGRTVYAQVPVLLRGAPPAEAVGRADGVGAAIAYIVVFSDLNGDHRLDHAYTGGAGATPDRILGVSNVAIVWRDRGVTHTGLERSSFIDTYDGYQTVTIGADSRADGGRAPWAVDPASSATLNAGCFAEDPTNPINASGLMQTAEVTAPLPDLLR